MSGCNLRNKNGLLPKDMYRVGKIVSSSFIGKFLKITLHEKLIVM